jgi:hypothetical protein
MYMGKSWCPQYRTLTLTLVPSPKETGVQIRIANMKEPAKRKKGIKVSNSNLSVI